jgi:hypothetical protein
VLLLQAGQGPEVLDRDGGGADSQLLVTPLTLFHNILQEINTSNLFSDHTKLYQLQVTLSSTLPG